MRAVVLYSIFFLLTLSLCNPLHGQQKSKSKIYLLQQNKIRTPNTPGFEPSTFFQKNQNHLGLTEKDEMRLISSRKYEEGIVHEKYQQWHAGVPVFGSAYSIHIKSNSVKSSSGYYLPLIDINTIPNIIPEEALELAMLEMDAEKYSWEGEEFKQFKNLSERPRPELYICSNRFPASSENYVLVYVVEIMSIDPFDKRQFFIDAHSGQLLFDLPGLMHQTVPAQGICKYYGEQTIYVDSLGPGDFYLRDLSRGDGIFTFDSAENIWTDEDNYWDLTNADQDEVAIDAHYCATEFYDFLQEKFNWNGLGNNGEALNSMVHGGDFVNAFWNGTFASFGDGDCNNGPLTTLEVVAHEFAHGITDYTSDLVYQGESGAINESLSDVLGKALEYYSDNDHFNWWIGKSFNITDYTTPFRSMEDPHIFEHPKFYKGEFWEDEADVHTNSSVGNHWFYLLVNGAEGINENGEAYDISGIGMDKAIQIVFQTQINYLAPNSSYPDYFAYSLLVTDDIFGANSTEVQQVSEAWKAVGLPYIQAGDNLDLSLSFSELFAFTCGLDEYYELQVTISNVGSQDYLPSMNGHFEIQGEYTKELLDTILPGESVLFLIEDYLLLDFQGAVGLDAELFLPIDENAANNNDFTFIENGSVFGGDLAMLFGRVAQRSCETEETELDFFLSNRSCSSIAVGTVITLTVTDTLNEVSWEEAYTLETELPADGNRRVTRTVELPIGKYLELIVSANYSGDPNSDNNMTNLFSQPILTLSPEYFTSVDDQSFDSLLIDGSFYEILEFGGNSYFASSSYSANSPLDLCPTPEGIIEGNFSSTSLSACLDFSQQEVPTVSFDLIQFRTSEGIDFPELYDFSALARIRWESLDGSGEEFFYGQAEEELVHYEVDLPSGFKGKLNFDFTSRNGNIFDSDYLSYDANLFDNLSISETLVSTEQSDQPTALKLYPNPGSEAFFIEHESVPEKVWLISSQGKLIQNFPPSGLWQKLDLSNLADGYYFVKVIYRDAGVVVSPLVKSSR